MGKMKQTQSLQFSSRVIHAGGHPDPETGAIMPPIYPTSTYVQKAPGKHQGYEYSRLHNPTRTRLQECLASLEGAKYAMAAPSGLSINTLIMLALPKGATILCGDDLYGGTYRMFTTVFHETHHFIFADTTDVPNIQKLIKEHRPALVWLESPSNPLLKISDIERLSAAAKSTRPSRS